MFIKDFSRCVVFTLFVFLLCGFNFLDNEYESIRKTVARVVESHPVSHSVYIGIGRSPTPLIAFMQQIGIQDARLLPLSQMMSYDQIKLNRPEVVGLMKEYLDKNLPTPEQLNGRTIVLIDFSLSGNSIIQSTKAIRDYYGKSAKVQSISIMSDRLTTSEKDIMKHQKIQILSISEKDVLFNSFRGQRYDQVSRIQQKLIWNTWSKMDPVDEIKVAGFEEALAEKIRQDPSAKKIAKPSWSHCIRELLF